MIQAMSDIRFFPGRSATLYGLKKGGHSALHYHFFDTMPSALHSMPALSLLQKPFHLRIVEKGEECGRCAQDREWVIH
jgi:hypothetical protein